MYRCLVSKNRCLCFYKFHRFRRSELEDKAFSVKKSGVLKINRLKFFMKSIIFMAILFALSPALIYLCLKLYQC